MGPEADTARRAALVRRSPVGMLTSWYNGPSDLDWMTAWRTTEVPRAYRAGHTLHLIVSMFRHFADVMAASDFQSFQAMESGGNAGNVAAMTRTLGAYGPVMLAHLKPDDAGQETFDADVRAILRVASLRRLRRDGLFAISFMDTANLDARPQTFAFLRRAVTRFGIGPMT